MEYYSNKIGEGKTISSPNGFSPIIIIPCELLKELFQEKLNEFFKEVRCSFSNVFLLGKGNASPRFK